MRQHTLAVVGVVLVLAATSDTLAAQAGRYLAMQPTRVAEREHNFALADFEMVVGAGLGLTIVEIVSVLRIPVGVAIGRRFPLERDYTITPFVHPRISFDRFLEDVVGRDATDTNLEIDVGGTFEINPQMQVRLAATLGDRSAVALSFAWLPRGLR